MSKRIGNILEAGQARYGSGSTVNTYQREASQLAGKLEQSGQKVDWSRIDFAVVSKMAQTGKFTARQLGDALLKASPCLSQRHEGNEAQYALRTIEAVLRMVPGAAEAVLKAAKAAERVLSLGR